MITELQKYRAQVFQILGFALMTPLGKFVLDLKDIKLENINLWFFLYLFISLFLTYLGIICIFKGEEKLEEYRGE